MLEYNVRFGDPETQAILVRLETDLVDICEAMLSGSLSTLEIKWRSGSSACVVLASEGYPSEPRTGDLICGLDKAAAIPNVEIFHAGTAIGSLIGLLGGPIGLGIGATAGVLAGGVADLHAAGVRADFIDEVSAALTPGKYALAAEISEEWVTPVDTRMEALGGVVFRTPRMLSKPRSAPRMWLSLRRRSTN